MAFMAVMAVSQANSGASSADLALADYRLLNAIREVSKDPTSLRKLVYELARHKMKSEDSARSLISNQQDP
jgi:hypothetical protein